MESPQLVNSSVPHHKPVPFANGQDISVVLGGPQVNVRHKIFGSGKTTGEFFTYEGLGTIVRVKFDTKVEGAFNTTSLEATDVQ